MCSPSLLVVQPVPSKLEQNVSQHQDFRTPISCHGSLEAFSVLVIIPTQRQMSIQRMYAANTRNTDLQLQLKSSVV